MFSPKKDNLTLDFEQKNKDRKINISKTLPLKGENLNDYKKLDLYMLYKQAEAYNNDLLKHGGKKAFGFYIDHIREFLGL